MTSTDLVRSSRDGDQFHYYWAARIPWPPAGQGTDAVPTGETVRRRQPEVWDQLTPQEFQIAQLTADGLANGG
jgi:DNA-binding NarL/FixJ family response regulator